eukprot:scaffold25845_cov112-Isochrysis_galbana.AAC.2
MSWWTMTGTRWRQHSHPSQLTRFAMHKKAPSGVLWTGTASSSIESNWRRIFATRYDSNFRLHFEDGRLLNEPSHGVPDGTQSAEDLVSEWNEYYRPPPTPSAAAVSTRVALLPPEPPCGSAGTTDKTAVDAQPVFSTRGQMESQPSEAPEAKELDLVPPACSAAAEVSALLPTVFGDATPEGEKGAQVRKVMSEASLPKTPSGKGW